jgi:hypothetical protein
MAVDNLIPRGLTAITPSDSAAVTLTGLRCTTAGTVKITDRRGNVNSLTLAVGDEIVLQIVLVWATGTTGAYLGYQD